MKTPKKKKIEKDAEADDLRNVSIEDLAKFTHSDVVEQLKIGMSRFAPLDDADSNSEPPY